MLIKLVDAKPNFERVWASEGEKDFLDALLQFERTHRAHGPKTLKHLSMDERTEDEDGIRRAWFYCKCGVKQLVLGPDDGRAMEPLFPRFIDPSLH